MTFGVKYLVDRDVPAGESVIRRYAPALYDGWLDRSALERCSLREGLRVIELGRINGVELVLLDETSGMTSGTYKSLDGCLTTAASLQDGAKRLVFSSGANTGSALTAYASRVGLETFFFCPASTLHKVDAQILKSPRAHLIAVEGADTRVKETAKCFADAIQTPLVPTIEWRLAAASSRGMFIAELAKEREMSFDWLSQTVCAAYGPIGLYRVLLELVHQGELEDSAVPRFMGVQQAGLAPLVEAWAAGSSELRESYDRTWSEPPIEPSLYNANPTLTYPRLRTVLQQIDGDMMAVSHGEFERESHQFLDILAAAGIHLTTANEEACSEPIEKAGLLCGVGTLRGIEQGRIKPGERVLCSLSGGVLPSVPQQVEPDCRLAADSAIVDDVRHLTRLFAEPETAQGDESARHREHAHAP